MGERIVKVFDDRAPDQAADRLPLALAELHHHTDVGAPIRVRVGAASWAVTRLRFVIEGAGFAVDDIVDDGDATIAVDATRLRTLPDTVGPGMHVLLVGLNPSPFAADAGVGFARPGNRFWPAALASGLVTRSHDPFHALRVDGVGMTNLVRRATTRADELARTEYVQGTARLERLVRWLEPKCVCFVGVTGYRVAIDKRAALGWQPEPFAGAPTYVMPNTSGLNAHAKPADFADHLRAVVAAA